MSIVIGAVTGNHAWIMSDGRQCSAADKSVIREDLPKFQMINEGRYIFDVRANGLKILHGFHGRFVSLGILQAIMTSKRIGKPRLNAQFIAVGRAAAGGMAVGTVDLTGRVRVQHMTSKDDAAFDILHDKAPISLEEQVGARLAKGQAFTAAIENGMKAVIKAQAERDPTVNTVIYQARI